MYCVFAILVASLLVGSVQSATVRNGNFNSYYVYTQTVYFNNPFVLTVDNIASSPLALTRNTAVIVHGHQGSGFTSLNPLVKNYFLQSEDVNVIVVDWSVYASQSYNNALNAVPSIAANIANLITQLVGQNLVAYNRLHLVGFDLGAHVVGFVGRNLNGEVARITGLNPSSIPWLSNFQILTRSDAQYVEVIHTDGGLLLSNGIGEVIGDVDFFINGGNNQPGCLLNNLCSHNRAWEVFAASLVSDHLIGRLCGSSLQVSLNSCRGGTLAVGNNKFIKYGSGIYRANTGRTFPF